MASATRSIQSLELIALRRLDGLLQGDYRGLFPGLGSEWSDARSYVPGDDPRRIDWPVTARTGETMVRDTIVDHELELWLVVDSRELALPDIGLVQLVDPESGRRRLVDTRDQKIRTDYTLAAARQRARIAESITGAGAHHLRVRTDGDWIADLVRFVVTRRQQRLAGTAVR